MSAELHIIMGTHDEPDDSDWIVGFVDRAEDVEPIIEKIYAQQRANRTILGPLRREERIFWKRYHDAQKHVSRELAVHEHDFDLLHKLTKAHQSAWIRRSDILRDAARKLADASFDRKPLYRLERVRYYSIVARSLDDRVAVAMFVVH